MTSVWTTNRIQIGSSIEENEDVYSEENRAKRCKIILMGLFIHGLLLSAVFDVYFVSPLDQGMAPTKSTEFPPAKRIVLIVADGLRAESIYGDDMIHRAPYLHSILENNGSWGVVHAKAPTESRPGHVAMLAGIYEDPSALWKGWKSFPVNFDSVLNQSTNAWAWGCPSVINIFNRDRPPRVHLHPYDWEVERLGYRDSRVLDTWVFQRVETFLANEVAKCHDTCSTYFTGGNIFFLHLNGVDTAGPPPSEEYIGNIRLVDENIKKTVALVESVFKDAATAYVFTSDHGMNDWGSHGGSSPHETEAPILAWGAGIAENKRRQDIHQIDIPCLLSSLIGINIPANSLGVLPADYLNVDVKVLAEMVLANTLQLFEIFKIKYQKIKSNAVVFLPFKVMSREEPSEKVASLKELFDNNKLSQLFEECQQFQSFLLRGINYYHTYYHYPILLSVSAGLLLWIGFVGATVLNFNRQTFNRKKKTLLPIISILIVISLCYESNFPKTHYFYFTCPFVIYFLALRNLEVSSIPLTKLSRSDIANIVFYAVKLQLLVSGFFNRIALTIIMVLVGLSITVSTTFRVNLSIREKFIWMICCFGMAVFPALPVVQNTSNTLMYIVAYVGWIITFAKMYLGNFKGYQQIEKDAVNFKVVSIQFLSLLIAAIYIVLLQHGPISSGSPLKHISWIVSTIPIIIIPLTSQFITLRLFAIFFGFTPFLLLLSTNNEALFCVFYIALLFNWLVIETKSFHYEDNYSPIFYSKFESYRAKRNVTLETLRISFWFMIFICLGFFGIGNIESLNSINPESVRAFLTEKSPIKMMVLVALKFMTLFIFCCSIFRAMNVVRKDSVFKMFCIVSIFSDLITLQFLYLITNQGSWLEMGSSLFNFITMEVFVIILFLLYTVASWLTRINLKI